MHLKLGENKIISIMLLADTSCRDYCMTAQRVRNGGSAEQSARPDHDEAGFYLTLSVKQQICFGRSIARALSARGVFYHLEYPRSGPLVYT